MLETKIVKILNSLLALDEKAIQIYSMLKKNNKCKALYDVWDSMQKDEEYHVKFWKKMLDLANEGDVPELFNDPDNVILELELLDQSISLLKENTLNDFSFEESIMTALKLEYYLIHPSMSDIFLFAKSYLKDINILENYDKHVRKIFSALKKDYSTQSDLYVFANIIEKLWKNNRQISRIASIDPLTGLLNRRGFFNAVKPIAHMAQRTETDICVFIIDIDDFKKINDTYGHQAGDDILMQIGSVLLSSFRESDIIGRYGGEEFIAMLTSVNKFNILSIAEKIRESIKNKTKDICHTSVSIGISTRIPKFDPMNELFETIKQADQNLYKAKNSGKDKAVLGM